MSRAALTWSQGETFVLLLSRPKLETPLRPLKTDSRSLGLCVHSPNPTGAAWSSRAWGINSSLRVQSPPSVQSVPLQTANVPVLTRAGCSDLFPSCVSLFSTQNAGAQDEKVSGKPKGRSAPPPDLHAPGSSVNRASTVQLFKRILCLYKVCTISRQRIPHTLSRTSLFLNVRIHSGDNSTSASRVPPDSFKSYMCSLINL